MTMQALRRIVCFHQLESRQIFLVSRTVHTSTVICKIHEVPVQTEVDDLKQQYPNPRRLVEGLLEPLVGCGLVEVPETEVVARLAGRYWRASLQLPWPSKVTVTAVHSSRPGAEENVYLLACHLLKNMGLLYQPAAGSGVRPVTASHVKKILCDLHSSFRHPFRPRFPAFRFDTVPLASSSCLSLPLTPGECPTILTPAADNYGGGGGGGGGGSDCTAGKKGAGRKGCVWVTEVSASWPYVFSLCAVAPSCHASKYAAALHTSIKLKSLGLLCQDNSQLATSTLESLSRPQWPSETSRVTMTSFQPHFELYTDASAHGFGAYLLSGMGDDNEHNVIHWLANTWGDQDPTALTDHDHPLTTTTQRRSGSESGGQPGMDVDSTLYELYAVVSALFNLKHRLQGCRVVVWTDNMAVVGLVNAGLSGKEDKVRRLGWLCSILEDTRRRHAIEVVACHVRRRNNRAADMLSRCEITAFRQAVPEASVVKIKAEKLPVLPKASSYELKTKKLPVLPKASSYELKTKKLPFVQEYLSKITTKNLHVIPEVTSSKIKTKNLHIVPEVTSEIKTKKPAHCPRCNII